MIEFENVVPALAQALGGHGYTELTPVQKAVLDSEIGQSDALVSAQTGSGKTVAFGLALAPTLLGEAERFSPPAAPIALVVAPTRELALQINRELAWLYEFTGAVLTSCVGGMDMRTERRALARGSHIVVGTPGRLRDHIQRVSLDTSNLNSVVLDEADEMLDLGFRKDLEFILDSIPADRRTLMFSATVPRSIGALAKKYQRDAVRIKTVGEAKQHLDISYRALEVAAADRENAIINVLRYYEAKNALVFSNTRSAVNHMTARLKNRGFSVVALSGELSQNERSQALQAMRDGRAQVCVATDVAARGIDLPNLELVIHADLPSNPDTLLHRSGRTGRAGRKGVSTLIVSSNTRARAKRLLKYAGIDATWAKPPSAEEITERDNERLVADPVLREPVQPDEHSFVQELLERYGPQQVAAAFVRFYRAGKSSPEELLAMEPRGNSKHRDFTAHTTLDSNNSVWFSISVGRKQKAEPRWLIPMLCKAGDITKRDIGSIKIQDGATYVELSVEVADRFVETIGPNRILENSITADRLEGRPEGAREPRNEYAGKKSRHTSESGGRGKSSFLTGKRSNGKATRKVKKNAMVDVGSTSSGTALKKNIRCKNASNRKFGTGQSRRKQAKSHPD